MLEDMEIPKALAFTIIQAVHEEDAAAKEAIYHLAELLKSDDIDPTTVDIAQQQKQERSQFLHQKQEQKWIHQQAELAKMKAQQQHQHHYQHQHQAQAQIRLQRERHRTLTDDEERSQFL